MQGFRIGFGYDAHRFAEGRPLIIGGTQIAHERGLKGHSDADVLTHAIIDAILGALSMGDIGRHFPDTDAAYEGMESTLMLEKVMRWATKDGYCVENVDATIVAERPRLAPYVEAMKQRMSAIMGIEDGQVSIKATTSEGMGFCGRGEGIAAYAVVCLSRTQGGG